MPISYQFIILILQIKQFQAENSLRLKKIYLIVGGAYKSAIYIIAFFFIFQEYCDIMNEIKGVFSISLAFIKPLI